jgi:adenosylmethionine-8-amino-7-oxononanoate aminotransferase
MKSFIKKLQKDLKNLETAVKKDSDELLKKVKAYATKENLTAAGQEIEKVLEKKLKEFEPTINKVVGEIRKNAAKAGINVDSVESTVRSTVKRATERVKSAAESRGYNVDKTVSKVKNAAKSAADAAKSAASSAKKRAEPVARKVVKKVTKKAKSPSTKAATIRKPATPKRKTRA